MPNVVISNLRGVHTGSNLLFRHHFVTDSRLLLYILGPDCLGNPLMYLAPHHMSSWVSLVVNSVTQLEVEKC